MARPAFLFLIVATVTVWAAETRAQSWVELTPGAGPAPSARRNSSAIYDPVENRMVIFGGFSTTFLNDVWGFDLDSETWINLTPAAGPPAPAPRLFPASVHDPVGHQMITWSGQASGVFFNDVWAFDLATNSWSPFTPTGGPPNIRYGVGYVFDPVARDLVTFAGFTNLGRFQDVWRFNEQAVTWTDVSPTTGPGERCLHSACYDAVGHRMIMHAGQNNSGPLDDLWVLDLETDTWTQLTPAVKPSARFFTSLVYDAANRRATLFGGQQTSTIRFNEAWVLDLWTNKWTQLAPSGTAPTARFGSAAIYDGANDRMIVFGGNDGVVRNDVWAIENLSNTVTGARPVASHELTLYPNHPNPFNPSTTIRFEVASRGRMSLRIYDVRGALVRTLFDGTRDAGPGSEAWDGRDDAGRVVSSGVYLYRLNANGESRTRKMVLLK